MVVFELAARSFGSVGVRLWLDVSLAICLEFQLDGA